MGFSIFGAFIPYYGFCIAIGIVCAFLVSYYLCKKKENDTDKLLIICAYLVAFGFLGAKVLYIIVSFKSIDFKFVFKSMKNFDYFISSGFVFYGGIVGGIFALVFAQKVHKINVKTYIHCIVPGLCVAHVFGRLGCSLAGCCYGKITEGPLYFQYTKSMIAPHNVKLFPVQGIEAVCVLILGIVCFLFVLNNSKIKVEVLYLLSYSLLRFILEFFRGDNERGFFLIFSTSQIISIIIFILVIANSCLKKLEYFLRFQDENFAP